MESMIKILNTLALLAAQVDPKSEKGSFEPSLSSSGASQSLAFLSYLLLL